MGIPLQDLISINHLSPTSPQIFEKQVLIIRVAFTQTPFMTATYTPRPPTRTPLPSRTPNQPAPRPSTHTPLPTRTPTPEPWLKVPIMEDLGPARPVMAYTFIGIGAIGLILAPPHCLPSAEKIKGVSLIMPKKVFVTGFFDLLHSGHVAFLEEAASYGDLYVAVGSDKTFFDLKGRTPVNSEQERLYMVQALGCVKQASVSPGSGMLDFIDEFLEVQPDLLIVNEDGNLHSKLELCRQHGVDYLVLQRTPRSGLAARSSTALRKLVTMPFRIDIAGGWLDQPYVSKHYPGPVITISIEPTVEFNNRSGMASSTRHKALDLWGPRLPQGDPEKLAKILFCYDNPPGTPHRFPDRRTRSALSFPG